MRSKEEITRSALDRAHLLPTTVFRLETPLSEVNALYRVHFTFDALQLYALLLQRAPNTSTFMGFSRRNKIPRCRVAVHMLREKESGSGIRTMIRIGLKS